MPYTGNQVKIFSMVLEGLARQTIIDEWTPYRIMCLSLF